MRTGWRPVFVTMLALTIGSASARLDAEKPPVDMAAFTGIWTYSSDLSEGVASLAVPGEVDAALSNPDEFGSNIADTFKTEALVEAIQREVETSNALIIGQSDAALVFADDHGRVRTLIGVEPTAPDTLSDRHIETAAHWDGSRIVRELSFGDGIWIVDEYTLVEDGQRLQIDTRLETPLRVSAIRRVYQLRPY